MHGGCDDAGVSPLLMLLLLLMSLPKTNTATDGVLLLLASLHLLFLVTLLPFLFLLLFASLQSIKKCCKIFKLKTVFKLAYYHIICVLVKGDKKDTTL
jgi:hypothetical protein